MVELLVIGTFLLVCATAIVVARAGVKTRPSAETLRAELLHADQRVTKEYLQARRAMNDAANQSWRNLAG